MYTLLSGWWKYAFQKDEYCMLILGLDNAGKTTFLEQTKTRFTKNHKGMSLDKITTTVGLNIGKIDIGGSRLMFWDLGGQEELQSLWDKYYAESHGIIYVIDSADTERLQESKGAYERDGNLFTCIRYARQRILNLYDPNNYWEASYSRSQQHCIDKMLANEHLNTVPLLILANKQDIAGCMTVLDIKRVFHDSSTKIGSRDCMIRPVSALTGQGVNEGIEWMVKCVERNPYRPPRQKEIT